MYLMIKSAGDIRSHATRLFFGYLFVFIGHFMDSEFFISTFLGIPLMFSPLIMMSGLILTLITQLTEIKLKLVKKFEL